MDLLVVEHVVTYFVEDYVDLVDQPYFLDVVVEHLERMLDLHVELVPEVDHVVDQPFVVVVDLLYPYVVVPVDDLVENLDHALEVYSNLVEDLLVVVLRVDLETFEVFVVDLVILVGHLVLVDHSIVDLEILVVLVVALVLLDALVDPAF